MRKLYPLLFVCPVLLAGCMGEEHEDLRQWMADQTKTLKRGIPPLPQVKPYDAVIYDTFGIVDPFKPSKILPSAKPGGTNVPDAAAREARNNPLEQISLEALKMIGFLRINNKPVAVLQADKLVKQVKVGNYLGFDYGVITEINEHEVQIRETVQDANGDWVERTNVLMLQSQEEKK